MAIITGDKNSLITRKDLFQPCEIDSKQQSPRPLAILTIRYAVAGLTLGQHATVNTKRKYLYLIQRYQGQ
jgi:hypothetical protein